MTIENSNIDKDKLTSTVKKLLSLAQSPNKAEAELAAQRAHELLEKYNLEMPSEVNYEVEEIVFKEDRSLKKWYHYLAVEVAEFYYCKTLRYSFPNSKAYRLSFIGRGHNLVICRSIFDYLHKAILREAKSIRKNAKMKYRDNFKYGMVFEIVQRLNAKRKSITTEGNALVISEAALIDKYLQQHNVERKSFDVKSSTDTAFLKGKNAGRKVSLDDQLSSGCKQIGYDN